MRSKIKYLVMFLAFPLIVVATTLTPMLSSANLTMTLTQCIQSVEKNNLNIDIALKNIEASYVKLAKLDSQLKANIRPSIDFGSEYQRQYKGITSLNTLKNSLTISYNLSALKKQDNLSQIFILKVNKLKKDILRAFLVYQVKINYFNLMKLKQELIVLNRNKKRLEKLKLVTQKLINIQLKLKSDLYKVENNIDLLKNDVLSKKKAITQQKYSLISLIFSQVKDGINFIDINIDKIKIPLLSVSMIEKNSPQIKSLNMQLKEISSRNIPIDSSLYPTLYSSVEQQIDWPNGGKTQYNFIVGIKVPILGNDTTKYDMQIKQIAISKKRLEIKKKKEEIRLNIKKLYKNIKFDKEIQLNYSKTYAHQQKTIKTLEVEYESGLNSDISQIINMQKDILRTKLKTIELFYDYKISLAKINYYNGEKR